MAMALVKVVLVILSFSETLSIEVLTSRNDLAAWKEATFKAVAQCPNPKGILTL